MARTRIARFNIQITATARQMAKTLQGISGQTVAWANNMRNVLGTLSFQWNNVAQAIGPIVQGFREMVDEMDELAKASSRLDILPQQLQAIEFAGGRVGIEMDTVRDALSDFQERLGQLRAGEPAMVAAFDRIGLTAREMSTDLAEAFEQVRSRIALFSAEADKAAIATELFGEAGRRLIDVFIKGDPIGDSADRMKEINALLTKEQLRAVEELSDAWSEYLIQMRAVTRVWVAEASPAIRKLIKGLGNLFRVMRAFSVRLEDMGRSGQQIRSTLGPLGPLGPILTAPFNLAQRAFGRDDTGEQTELLREIRDNTEEGEFVAFGGII